MSQQQLMQRKSDATPRGVGVMCSFFAERAKNAEVWDTEGRRYIDFAGGIGVLNTGHLHPKVEAAVAEQLSRFSHTCYQVVPYESYISLAEKLNQLTPGSHAKKTALFTTGAEAVENAVKIARAATGRPGVIAFGGAFHGRTLMGMALTGKVAPYKLGFGPFPSDVYHAPYPNALHGVSVQDSLAGLEKLFKFDIDPARVAAIIYEPVQGEGGFYAAPAEWVKALRALCDRHGILLIADEVQTGFARTGKLLASEHFDAVPDLITMAKSLAGGFPLSAVTGRAEVMDAPAPGGLGGTYAGNPLALAAAHAVLDVIDSEKLNERAQRLGGALKEKLNGLKSAVPQIAEVRGLGAMIAVEFNQPGSHTPDPDFAKKVQQHALANGLILLTCGIYANVVRFLFPLTIEDDIFAEALDKLEAALKA
ncbi:4-aminobutyrate--2-oxoglutarate transaminase [Chromobacterium vaccinii]|uniref:4-aminobutyrate--2-oxoglutarate transaminase n=1 Tax=Chromobacterium piscinae TaxID=686831 RepID=A0ABV0H4Q4_9NEIS|nr:4-aminobutyrate--2-oxoglutarate transaminase [Chromobacterium piscinae]MBX9295344.1 4-aminobutyrate--2-oxoglutarate transaminase [Chromobacterium vaccinii]MBX9349908.1 4-aminobutyrate--2-oxoglutarate transaminase [Chromobacterium vaccinii]MBX9357351.1 4-aminobutyrate--2-oxoglutarate transaminase [Chromobacterium vaccinii]MCD4503586.1 4-aminobutyrate--2-oxoglutarate transaminase [Chromobacterium piscinae]NHQ83957.1 4-aminobutyrate--2-oxoglutarate transaminase [Chromobacterium vaccinii]